MGTGVCARCAHVAPFTHVAGGVSRGPAATFSSSTVGRSIVSSTDMVDASPERTLTFMARCQR